MTITVNRILTMLSIVLLLHALPLQAQHNPYVDDKLFHFGFSVGVDFLS